MERLKIPKGISYSRVPFLGSMSNFGRAPGMILDPDLVGPPKLWVSQILSHNGKMARTQAVVSMVLIFDPT